MSPSSKLLAALLAVSVVGCGGGSDRPEVTEGYGLRIKEAGIRGAIDGAILKLSFPLEPTGAASVKGTLSAQVVKLGGGVMESPASVPFEVSRAQSVELQLAPPPFARLGDLGGYVVRYWADVPGGQLYGRRSLFVVMTRSSLVVIGNDHFAVGEKSTLRARVVDAGSGEGIPDVPVTIVFAPGAVNAPRSLASGKTGKLGELEASFVFGEGDVGAGTLRVQAGAHESQHAVVIERERQILLTTDKPLYQPGQTVHIRALAMRQPGVVPVAGEPLLIEVEDAQRNKLFKQETKTDAYGIASLRFELARIVGLGEYTVRVSMGAAVREKKIQVQKYVLPKFRVTVQTNKAYYKPGEQLGGSIQADYFFNKHVQQGDVTVAIAIPGQKPLTEINGKTGDDGKFAFQAQVPNGSGLLLEATVTDASGAQARGQAAVLVSAAERVLQLVPERSTVRVGESARFFVMLTDPAGTPQSGSVGLGGSLNATVNVPASGVAVVAVPTDQCGAGISVSATASGAVAHAEVRCVDAASALQVSADRALYKDSDSATLTVRGPSTVAAATLEVVRHNVTVAAQQVSLGSGTGKATLKLGGELRGVLELKAFAAVGDKTIADRQLIYVRGADLLNVAVAADKQSYRPAEKAQVTLTITDSAGKPAPGALGVQVVDEALYALTEFRPGLERRTFLLEQEVVSGQSLRFLDPGLLLAPDPGEADQLRAQMLFAASGQRPIYPIDYRSGDQELSLAITRSRAGLDAMMQQLEQELESSMSWSLFGGPSNADRGGWVASWLAGRGDDFGVTYKVEVTSTYVTVRSAGMDETWGTADDLSAGRYIGKVEPLPGYPIYDGGYARRDAGAMADSSAPPPGVDGGVKGDAGAATSTQQLRQYFPETLYVNPALITDAQGKATVDLTLADSITTWKLSAIAHTQQGQLGSTEAGLTVFQEFFVDTLLPAQLLQNDEVEVPVAIYNYLGTPQAVTVTVKSEPWFELLEGASKQVTVPAKSVSAATFRIRAKLVGSHTFTATGTTGTDSDGVKRAVQVLPDGERQEVLAGGVLKPGTTSHTVSFPKEAIAGASELYVKVYPGLLSEVVQGLESLLSKPYGCFEQTSSTTYPNVMVLQYLKASSQSTPALEQKAKAYIDEGYQRLVTFEVPGGGFSLYGKAPAVLSLTAFGLLEFSDMAKVRYVDPALITRTQSWLVGQQSSSGQFLASGYGYYGSSSGLATLQTTAYVAWALARSGYSGAPLVKALDYLRANVDAVDESYTLALAANALLAASPADSKGLAVLAKLKGKAQVTGTSASWSSMECGVMHSYGQTMAIETTALAISALLTAKDMGDLSGKALRYLAANKGALGDYGSTQATVLAINALMLALTARGGDSASGTIEVTHEGVVQGTATVTPATSDVTRLFDLKPALVEGAENDVAITFAGTGELTYQVVGVYYLPHGSITPSGPLAFSLAYDKTVIKVNESITVTATVKSSGPGSIPAVLVRVGLPPGFVVDLDAIVAGSKGLVNNAEQMGAYVVLYLGTVSTAQSVSFPMTATLAVKAKAPVSTAYPYYTPEYVQLAEGPTVTVTP